MKSGWVILLPVALFLLPTGSADAGLFSWLKREKTCHKTAKSCAKPIRVKCCKSKSKCNTSKSCKSKPNCSAPAKMQQMQKKKAPSVPYEEKTAPPPPPDDNSAAVVAPIPILADRE